MRSRLSSGSLDRQYQIIGHELLQYEMTRAAYGYRPFSTSDSFREGTAFIGLETLENYLEDLLDPSVDEERLYITRQVSFFQQMLVPASGLLVALSTGLYTASERAPIALSLVLTVSMALPFILAFYRMPRNGIGRRMMFAQLLSREVARRRGRDRDGGNAQSAFSFPGLFGSSPSSSVQGMAFLSAARRGRRYHH